MSSNATAELLLGEPGNPPKIKDALTSFLLSSTCKDVRCAFAYVSLAGIAESVAPIFEPDEYRRLRKRWVVGIHNGITEPAAIEALVGYPNSAVRVFSPTGSISKAALFGSEKLHPKAICLAGDEESLFVVGSANLTRAAIGAHCSNYEAGALMQTSDNDLRAAFAKWFDSIWERSIRASSGVVNRYSQIREQFLRENRIVVPRLDEMPANAMGLRQRLWIEAGAMSGGDRNQVEFGPALAAFFGNPVRGTVRLRMKWRRVTRDDRPLSYKVTQWNTEIWRLSMITAKQGGPPFPGRIIHLTRMRDRHGEYFSLDVASPDSAKARSWRKQANRRGTLAMTGLGAGSAREYGVY